MSGLGHFLEDEGLATTGVSLIREHAEVARPPRSLAVPFDFGHPFGAAGDAALQRDVLCQALALFERPVGPVLEDWRGEPGSAAEHPDGSAPSWSCPIPLRGVTSRAAVGQQLLDEARRELERLMPWYEHAVHDRGRTTVGASGLETTQLLPFIAGFLGPDTPDSPNAALPSAIALKSATEDLKQIYLEAASAQPVAAGTRRASHVQLNDWFWRDTRASDLIRAVGERIRAEEDPAMQMVATFLLMPFMRSADDR